MNRSALLALGLVASVWCASARACSDTRLFSLGASAPTTVASLETLFPDVRFQFDAKAGTLEATGCPDQLACIESLVETERKNDLARWQSEVSRRLWTSSGLLKHSQFGFGLQRPPAEWKIVSVLPDHAYAARLRGRPIFGLKFLLKHDALTFLAIDLDRSGTARNIGEPDANLPLELWPQAVSEKNWAETFLGEFLAPRGGLQTPGKTSYRARLLWHTGTDKLVCDRVYLAQPFADGIGTRLYLFMATLAKSEYQSHAMVLPKFVAGFSMPDILKPAAIARTLLTEPAPKQTGPVIKQAARKSLQPHVPYKWQVENSSSPLVQAALAASRSGELCEAEQLWTNLLPSLPHSLRSEALWFLARAQDGQGKTQAALGMLDRLLKESFSGHPLLFDATFCRGHLLGHRRRQWDLAEIEWKKAATLARDAHQQWQVATRLATVPYYKKQTRQAIDALEDVLREHPTRETADFVAPYLWYLKNCAQKHI